MKRSALLVFAVTAPLMVACSEGSAPPLYQDGGIPWLELPDFGPWPDTLAPGSTDGLLPSAPDAGAAPDVAVEQSPPGTDACKAGLSSEGTRWVKVAGGTQNLYDKPNTAGASAAVLGSVPEGDKMDFFPSASKDGWACVLHGGIYGYVDASALTTTPPTGGFSCKPGLPQNGNRWVKEGTGALNLRGEPHVGAAILTVIPEGSGFPVAYYPDGDDAGWACVGYGSEVGYASAKYLAAAPPAPSSAGDSGGDEPDYDSGTGSCVSDTSVGCWWLTKPCDWRTTKADCLSLHWWSGEACCIWSN